LFSLLGRSECFLLEYLLEVWC